MEVDFESEFVVKKKLLLSSRKKEVSRRRRIRRREREERSSGENSDSDSGCSSYDARRKKRKNPRNPLALQRQQNAALLVLQSPVSSNKKSSQNDDNDDGFMSDCDPPVRSPATSEEKLKAKTNQDRSSSAHYIDATKRKKRKKSRCESDEEDLSRKLFVEHGFGDDVLDEDALNDLKPTLENPNFPPSELEPLVLGECDGRKVSVPASLSRYLAPFQKDGVQFMYRCLAQGSGVILGDDMGCGKTIQVIALLCALFEKTGTGMDLKEIKERNKKVAKYITDVRRLKDEAIRRGEFVEENEEELTKTLGVSSWHPVLVVVPPAVVSDWMKSLDLFSHFSVSEYSGERAAQAIDDIRYGNADILLCRESLFKSSDHFARINFVKWKLVVIDEFHSFKNPKTKASAHVRALKKAHNPLMLGMTGTLMQNNHSELWNLVDLIQTDFLGEWDEFKQFYERTIARGRQKGATAAAEKKGEEAAKMLRSKIYSIMIERKKEDVLKDDLPDKDEQVVLCGLSSLQKEVYRHVIDLPDFELVKKAQAPCDCGINQNFFRKFNRLSSKAERLEFYRNHKEEIVKQSKCCKQLPINLEWGEEGEPKIDPDAVIWRTMDVHNVNEIAALEGCEKCPWCCAFPCMAKLMKLSNHVGLLQADKSRASQSVEANVKYTKDREFAKVALAGIVKKLPGGDYDRHESIMNDHFALSGKLETADCLLTKYQKQGCKVLLFSHSTQTLDLIENYVKSRGTMEYLRLDGSISTIRRKELTDKFQTDPATFLFLLSTKACGLGLNLTAANRVILFDQNWNPAWEDQAQDRAYRIGQTQDVHVVRLVAQGTVEEMVYIRQIYKKMLKQGTLSGDKWSRLNKIFRGVQGDKDRKGELFGYENLFRYKDGSFLDDIWKGFKGKKDASGLKIHQSGKIAEVLKDNIDFQDKLEAIENVEILEALSEGVKDKPNAVVMEDTFDLHDLDSEDESDTGMNIPLKQRVRVMNQKDIFRSDKGGAAISEGEDGFEEEMGGGTQNAYAVYEQKKDEFSQDSKSDSDVATVGGRSLHFKSGDSNKEDAEETEDSKPAPTATPKSESNCPSASEPDHVRSNTCPTADFMYPTHMDEKKGIKAFSKSRKVPSPDKVLSTHMQPVEPENLKIAAKLAKASCFKSLSGPTRQSSKKPPSKASKIQLAGVPDVENAKTDFSIDDLALPKYVKKKKKKKKRPS
jgi:SNF2 family DNA or RNA helicase